MSNTTTATDTDCFCRRCLKGDPGGCVVVERRVAAMLRHAVHFCGGNVDDMSDVELLSIADDHLPFLVSEWTIELLESFAEAVIAR